MTRKKHTTPMLDELENGPWPSFVTGIKQLRDKHSDEKINGVANGPARMNIASTGPW